MEHIRSGTSHEGTLPAPYEHIRTRITPWHNRFHLTYTATAAELRSAGVADAFMEEKILNQRSGTMLDSHGNRFRIRAAKDDALSATLRRPKRTAWESGEPIRLTFDVCRYNAPGLPGVRELCPEGFDDDDVDQDDRRVVMSAEGARPAPGPFEKRTEGLRVKRARRVGRRQRIVQWASGENVIWPNWQFIHGSRADPAPAA